MSTTTPEYKIEEAGRRVERAVETFKTGEAALHNTIGQRVYSDAVHNEKLSTLRDSLKAEIERAQGIADEIVSDAEKQMLLLQNADPLDALTTEQLALANQKRAFVAEDAQSMPLHQLTGRLEAVLAAGDAVNSVLWGRYAGRRIAAEVADGRGQSDTVLSLQRMLTDAGGGSPDITPMRDRIKAARQMRMRAHTTARETYLVAEAIEQIRA